MSPRTCPKCRSTRATPYYHGRWDHCTLTADGPHVDVCCLVCGHWWAEPLRDQEAAA